MYAQEIHCSALYSLCVATLFCTLLINFYSSTPADRPKFQQLHYLKRRDGTVIRVVEEAAQQWERLAYALNFPRSTVNVVSRDNPQNAVGACGEMLGRWLDGVEGTRQPISWNSLIDALCECDMDTFASDLHDVLS